MGAVAVLDSSLTASPGEFIMRASAAVTTVASE
jgi:hypothetical protein